VEVGSLDGALLGSVITDQC